MPLGGSPSLWGSVCIEDGSSVRVSLVRDALTPGHIAFPPARCAPIALRLSDLKL